MLDKLKAAFEKARDKAEEAAAAAMPKVLTAPESVATERFAMCSACEHFYSPTHQCKKCGCFMKVKTTLAKAECPIGKWKKWEDPNKTE